jgi:hypothetical protein
MIENIFAIKPGSCGPEFVNCEQLKVATKPLPPDYMPPDYKNADAVAVRGYYPTQSCIRHHPQSSETTASMEGFTLR